MKISKANINGNSLWIEEENNNFFVLDFDENAYSFTRQKELNINSEDHFKFDNIFNGINVFGLAYNYKSLVGEKERYDEPLIFLKSKNSTCPSKSIINLPREIDKVWVEAELAVIISKKCKNVSIDDANNYIFGYTIASDITAQNICHRDHHLAKSKALDNFAPLGPWIVTDLDASELEIETFINGRQFQHGNTNDRILNDFAAVSLISKSFTLFPGDIILTGTPANAMNSLVQDGDVVIHKIENLGELRFTIKRGNYEI